MAGDADFKPFLDAVKPETGKTHDGKETWTTVGTGGLIASIVQKAFPEYVKNLNTKVTAQMPEYGVTASYGGLAGDTIKAGKLTEGNITTYTDKKGNSVVGGSSDDSDTVMEGVTTMLHELYHARISKAKIGEFKSPNLGANWKDLVKDAQKLQLPSLGSGFGGDNLEELLATAVPITQMRAMGMTPTGTWKGHAASIDKLQTKYPWLKKYIADFAKPEQISAVAKAMKPEDPSMLDSIGNAFSKLLK
jgi:hypothetical protein